jgi:hypothetical protein
LRKDNGLDNIPAETLKTDLYNCIDMLSSLWEAETIPRENKKGCLIKLPKMKSSMRCTVKNIEK